jgi:hypothetical protein
MLRRLQPLVKGCLNSLAILGKNFSASAAVNERPDAGTVVRLSLGASGQRRVVREGRKTIRRARRVGAIEERAQSANGSGRDLHGCLSSGCRRIGDGASRRAKGALSSWTILNFRRTVRLELWDDLASCDGFTRFRFADGFTRNGARREGFHGVARSRNGGRFTVGGDWRARFNGSLFTRSNGLARRWRRCDSASDVGDVASGRRNAG